MAYRSAPEESLTKFLNVSFGHDIITGTIPETKSSEKCVRIISCPATGRQFFQPLGIASAKNHIVRMNSVDKSSHTIRNVALPFLLAEPF